MNQPGHRSDPVGTGAEPLPPYDPSLPHHPTSPHHPHRVALVTGGAKRLGRAIALALAASGSDVAIHYHRSRTAAEQTADEIRALGRRAVCLPADLAQPQAVLELVPAVTRALGSLTVLVNNASLFRRDDISDFSYASLQAHLLPNLAAPITLAREMARALPSQTAEASALTGGVTQTEAVVTQTEAVVINLLDQKLYNPNPDFLSYTLSKAGLAQATTLLAQALAPRVRVVGVAPGLTLPSYLQDDSEFIAAHRRYSPLGRSSTPADVAAAVQFAVSNRALTGTVIVVDGGQHLMGLPRDVSLMPTVNTPSPSAT